MSLITSDLHFWHSNILKFSPVRSRFETVESMNEYLIDEWNSKVNPEDTMYHLGDFCFASKSKTEAILERLNGHKKFVLGNHDKHMIKLLEKYGEVAHYLEVKHGNTKVCMSHYPFLAWNMQGRGSVMMHGHCHGNLKPENCRGRILDVGWCNHGKILTLDEAVEWCLNRDIYVADGHKVVE